MKKVNIVVVTFNRKELLLRLLKRLVEQSFQPNKIIVIDNASTDGTPDYVSEFVSAHEQLIHYCRLKTNTGGSGGFHTVSYTHLDVYKRQAFCLAQHIQTTF